MRSTQMDNQNPYNTVVGNDDEDERELDAAARVARPSDLAHLTVELRRGHGVVQRIRAGLDELITELPRYVANVGHIDTLGRRMDAIGSRLAAVEEILKRTPSGGGDPATANEIRQQLADINASLQMTPAPASSTTTATSRRWMYAALALGTLLGIQVATTGGPPRNSDGNTWAWVGRIWSDNDAQFRTCISQALNRSGAVTCQVIVRP